MPGSVLLWILLSVFVKVHLESIPDCNYFYYKRTGKQEGVISFFAPKTSVQNGFVLKVEFIKNLHYYFPGCLTLSGQSINKAGFNGNGYIELPAQSLKKRANFTFLFKTLKPDALLILSGHPPHFNEDTIHGNFSVNLIKGKIKVKINAGNGPIKLTSNLTLNDGKFHVVSVTKTGRRFELYINDEFQSLRLFTTPPFIVNLPEGNKGGLYVGGAPSYDEFSAITTLEPFEGTIKDLVFNNKSIFFENIISWGRDGPTIDVENQIITREETPELSARRNELETVNDIINGYPISIIVKHNSSEPLDVTRILVNDQIVCEGGWDFLAGSNLTKEVQLEFKPPSKIKISTSATTLRTSKYVSVERCGMAITINEDQIEFPWVAEVFVRQNFKCEASFISKTRAITASSCFEDGVKAEEVHLFIFSKRYIPVRGYKKHPHGLAILETETIDETDFVPVCLTTEAVLIGTYGLLIQWTSGRKQFITNGFVTTNDECNENSLSEYEFCLLFFDSCDIYSGNGFFTYKDGRWFLSGVVVRSNNECVIYFQYTTDRVVLSFFSFVTGNYSIESFDSYTETPQKIISIATATSATLDSEEDESDLLVNISSYSDTNCGIRNRVSELLQGGERKIKMKWPWVAAMYDDEVYTCTANFISRTRAVTAAHCFENETQANDIKLRIFTGKNMTVNSYKMHPSYENVPKYDIAILDTERIDEDNFVPICLTDDNSSLLGQRGYILSYTPTSENDTESLYGIKFSVVQKKYCKSIELKVPSHTFCVNQGHRGSFLCHGDSGSGFFIRYELQYSKRYFLRGVVSTGGAVNGTCTVDDYVIFTDVTKFLSFVTES